MEFIKRIFRKNEIQLGIWFGEFVCEEGITVKRVSATGYVEHSGDSRLKSPFHDFRADYIIECSHLTQEFENNGAPSFDTNNVWPGMCRRKDKPLDGGPGIYCMCPHMPPEVDYS